MSLSPWIFTKLIDVIAAHLRQRATFSIPRRLVRKRSDMLQTHISHNILPPNSSKSRKPKKVRVEASTAIHLDTTEYSQGTTRLYRITNSDSQTISNSDSSFRTKFPFSFGHTQCCSRLSFSRQTLFTTATNVSVVGLETSYSTTESSRFHQYDLILFEMVDGHQSICSGNIHPSSNPNAFLFMDSSHYGWGAHLELMRLSLHGGWTNPMSISTFKK